MKMLRKHRKIIDPNFHRTINEIRKSSKVVFHKEKCKFRDKLYKTPKISKKK